MTPDERKASGAAQRNGTRCSRCYTAYWRTGQSERTTWKLEHLIEEAEFLFDGGADYATIARRLGLKPESLVRQYRRARDRGLTTRDLSYRRTE
jgi:transposase-like protein